MWTLTDEQIEAMTPQRRELIIRPDVVVVTDQAELEGLSIVRLGRRLSNLRRPPSRSSFPCPGCARSSTFSGIEPPSRATLTRVKGFKPVTRPNPAPVQPFSHIHIFMVNRRISDQMKE